MLAAQKRWWTLIAGAISVSVLIASRFLIEGGPRPLRYATMSQMPAFSPTSDVMPTISALASRLPLPVASEIVGAIAIVLLLWTVCRRSLDLGMAGAAAAAGGLLMGHHALFADTVLLIPLAVLTIQRQSVPPWLKAWAALMLSPAPFLLAFAWQKPMVWQALIAPFVVTALWGASVSPPPVLGNNHHSSRNTRIPSKLPTS
jgi:hypothetical protein